MFSRSTQSSNTNQSSVDTLSGTSDEVKPEDMPWDHADPFVSAHVREVVKVLTKCYLRQLLLFVGTAGNILSCIVFKKQGLSNRINLLLFSLAVADFLNLTSHFLLIPDCYFTDSLQTANWLTLVNAKIIIVALCTNLITGIHIVIVNVDRCLSVALPLKARSLLTYRRLGVAILLTYVVPVLTFLPQVLAFTVKWRTDPSTNRSVAYMEMTKWLPGGFTLALIITKALSFVFKPVCLVIMITCCIIIVISLSRSARQRVQMTGVTKEGNEARDNRITRMLLFICVVYIILIFPDMCNDIASVAFPEYHVYRKYHNTLLVVKRFVWVASCLNSSINFFAYLALSSAFRRTLKELCVCSWKKRH